MELPDLPALQVLVSRDQQVLQVLTEQMALPDLQALMELTVLLALLVLVSPDQQVLLALPDLPVL
jgi:hypothetical protein